MSILQASDCIRFELLICIRVFRNPKFDTSFQNYPEGTPAYDVRGECFAPNRRVLRTTLRISKSDLSATTGTQEPSKSFGQPELIFATHSAQLLLHCWAFMFWHFSASRFSELFSKVLMFLSTISLIDMLALKLLNRSKMHIFLIWTCKDYVSQFQRTNALPSTESLGSVRTPEGSFQVELEESASHQNRLELHILNSIFLHTCCNQSFIMLFKMTKDHFPHWLSY